MSKVTTVEIKRAEEVGGKWYFGSDSVVPVDVAEELVKRGSAKILDKEFKAELKAMAEDAPDKPTGTAPAPPSK